MIHIISGKWRRRQIPVVGKTRPPLQRTKEWIFNVLLNYISLENIAVLDLCAGSGSLGLECLSRGADKVYFVEENTNTAKNLSNTLKNWMIDNGRVLKINVCNLPLSGYQADLIFIDPPFGHSYVEKIISKAIHKNWAKSESIFVLRTNYEIKDHKLNLLNSCKMGKSYTYLYKNELCLL